LAIRDFANGPKATDARSVLRGWILPMLLAGLLAVRIASEWPQRTTSEMASA